MVGERKPAWAPADILIRVILFLWAIAILGPLVWIGYSSLKTNVEFFQSTWSLPSELQFGNYAKAWDQLGIGRSLLNTAYFVGVTVILGTAITVINAYALTRISFPGRKFILMTVFLSLFLPGINAILPQYILMRSLHLTNSLNGLIILLGVGQNVFTLFLLAGFMQSIPRSLEESVLIDGGNVFHTFRHIGVPLALPGIITILILNFLGLYNAFLQPLIYLSDPKKYTIGVSMYQANQLMQYRSDWVTLLAGVVLAMVPPVAFYIIFQKQVARGATLGALKG
jgi:N-acetylglucosamine transport system permease protein